MIVKSFLATGMFEENSFLIVDEQTGATAIVDPSFEDKSILDSIARIDYILLTHSHYDHIESVEFVKEKYRAKVVCHKDEESLLTNANYNLSSSIGTITEIKPDCTLEDGQIMKLGELEIKCMHTPGHTMGGACYIANDYIFTGDTVMAGTIGREDLPTGNYNQLMGSVSKIKKLEKNYTLCCGHGGNTTLDREKRTNMYFR